MMNFKDYITTENYNEVLSEAIEVGEETLDKEAKSIVDAITKTTFGTNVLYVFSGIHGVIVGFDATGFQRHKPSDVKKLSKIKGIRWVEFKPGETVFGIEGSSSEG